MVNAFYFGNGYLVVLA